MKNLQSQESTKIPLRLRPFYGTNTDLMPLLLSGKNKKGKVADVKRTPITVKQVLYDRIHSKHENERIHLRHSSIDTGDVIIVDPKGSGETIIGLYTNPSVKELVHSLNPKSPLEKGSLLVSTEQYQAIKKEAFVLSPKVANALRDYYYNEQKAREGFWDYVAEGDTGLVRDNLAFVQKSYGGDMSDRMGLYLDSNPGLRLLCARSVAAKFNARGYDLRYYCTNGHLVGVAAESLARKNLESKVDKKIQQF